MTTKAAVAIAFFAMIAVGCYATGGAWPLLAVLVFGSVMSWFG